MTLVGKPTRRTINAVGWLLWPALCFRPNTKKKIKKWRKRTWYAMFVTVKVGNIPLLMLPGQIFLMWDVQTEEIVKTSQQCLLSPGETLDIWFGPLNPLHFLQSHNRNHPNWTHYCLGWERHRSLPQSNTKGGKDSSEDQRLWASWYTGHLWGKRSTQIIKYLNNGLRARTSRLRESFLHQAIRSLNST